MAYDAQSGKVVLFGGEDAGGGVRNDTWTYDVATNTWTRQFPATSPSARSDASMVYDAQSNLIVLFGGESGTGAPNNETWTYDAATDTWAPQIPPVGSSVPQARWGASMAYDAGSGKIVLLGGTPNSFTVFGQTWTYDVATNVWTARSAALFAAAVSAAMSYDPQSEVDVQFGGNEGGITKSLASTDTYKASGDTWTQQSPAISPPARSAATIDYDAKLGESVLFGGYESNGNKLGDTWTYDAGTDAWTKQSPSTSPPDRDFASMAYDTGSGKLVLFGGRGNGLHDDTWVYGPLPRGSCQRKSVTIKVVPGVRVTRGTPHHDVILGNTAANKIRGLGGNDVICGGGGNDIIAGQGGKDSLSGDGGADKLLGGKGSDVLKGGAGRDRLLGGPGHDKLRGGPGVDITRPDS